MSALALVGQAAASPTVPVGDCYSSYENLLNAMRSFKYHFCSGGYSPAPWPSQRLPHSIVFR